MKQKAVISWGKLSKELLLLCLGTKDQGKRYFFYIMSLALWSIKLNGTAKRTKKYMYVSVCSQSFITNQIEREDKWVSYSYQSDGYKATFSAWKGRKKWKLKKIRISQIAATIEYKLK